MNDLSGKSCKQILIINNAGDIALAMETTKKIAKHTGFTEHESIMLQLVTEEACMNAFEHGHPLGHCDFRISWLVDADTMEIKVCQNGDSFELQNDPVTPVRSGSRGRGLVLIQGIMDEVKLIPSSSYVSLLMRKRRRVT